MRKLSFKRALTLAWSALKGNWLRTAITVILLAFCAMAFGLSSTMFMADYTGKQVKLFSASPLSTVGFVKADESDSTKPARDSFFEGGYVPLAPGRTDVREYLSGNEITRIEEATGLEFARIFAPTPSMRAFMADDYYMGLLPSCSAPRYNLFYGDYDRRASVRSLNEGLLDGTINQGLIWTPYERAYSEKYVPDETEHGVSTPVSDSDDRHAQNLAYIPEVALGEFGFSLLAGKMPQEADEVAICECFLHEFIKRGYYLYEDVEAGNMVEPLYNHFGEECYDPHLPEYYILNEDEFPAIDESKVVKVTKAEDLVGKKIALLGNLESGTIFGHRVDSYFHTPADEYYTVTITGVLDTGCGIDFYKNISSTSRNFYLQDCIYVSKAWTDIFFPNGEAYEVIAPRPTDRKAIERVISLLEETFDRYDAVQIGENFPSDLLLIVEEKEITRLLLTLRGEFKIFTTISSGCGVITAVFGGLLCMQLISASVEGKRKQMGVMKALGARDRDIYKIYLLESLLLGLVIFLLATACVAALCWGWLYPLGVEVHGIPLFDFGILQILCILLVSVGLPVLCALLPIKKFLKRSCVEMMKNSAKGKVGRPTL